MKKLNIDQVREKLEAAVKARGKSSGIQSRQVLALMEVLVDAINDANESPMEHNPL